jgi:hypothetical protein
MEIVNVKDKKLYVGEDSILTFLLNDNGKRGRMILRYNNVKDTTKITLREPKENHLLRKNELSKKEGIEAFVEDLTNKIIKRHYDFIGVNYREVYQKLNKSFNKNTMFIFKTDSIEDKDYKLSIYGSVEFSEFN